MVKGNHFEYDSHHFHNIHVAPLADNQTFRGQQAIGSDNAINKDHPRLKRTAKLNVTKGFLHIAIIKTHSSYALRLSLSFCRESEDTILLILKEIYAKRGISPVMPPNTALLATAANSAQGLYTQLSAGATYLTQSSGQDATPSGTPPAPPPLSGFVRSAKN